MARQRCIVVDEATRGQYLVGLAISVALRTPSESEYLRLELCTLGERAGREVEVADRVGDSEGLVFGEAADLLGGDHVREPGGEDRGFDWHRHQTDSTAHCS